MDIQELPKGKKIILFDGVCNLCDKSVQFIIKRDTKDVFRFTTINSDIGEKIIKHIGFNKKADSIILYEPGKAYYIKAEAVIKIAQNIGWPYNLISILSIIPKSITNYIYDYIAKNRYKWYGNKDECMIPSSEIKSKFLE